MELYGRLRNMYACKIVLKLGVLSAQLNKSLGKSTTTDNLFSDLFTYILIELTEPFLFLIQS